MGKAINRLHRQERKRDAKSHSRAARKTNFQPRLASNSQTGAKPPSRRAAKHEERRVRRPDMAMANVEVTGNCRDPIHAEQDPKRQAVIEGRSGITRACFARG